MPTEMNERDLYEQERLRLQFARETFIESPDPDGKREEFLNKVRARLIEMHISEESLTPAELQKYLISYFKYNNPAPNEVVFRDDNVEQTAKMIFSLMNSST